MSETVQSTIFVLTDTPEIYGTDLNHHNTPPTFVKEMSALIAQLKQTEMAGLVLEVGKVMKATRLERDRLFSFAETYPVMRTKPDKKRGAPVYLDPKDVFFTNLEAAAGKRSRSYVRKTVQIECSFSQEEDPSMAEPQKGTILDISSGGCFINTRQFSEESHFLYICIPELGCNRPIFSSVRWTRMAEDPALCGMGVLFIDIAENLTRAIEGYQS